MEITVIDGLFITLIGLVVVFAVLLILVGLIELLHIILKDRKPAEKTAQAQTEEPRAPRVLHPVAVPLGDAIEKDGEFLAAVSAAVASYINKLNGSFEIKSIKLFNKRKVINYDNN